MDFIKEEIVTGEGFYLKLKSVLIKDQVLYVTRSVGRNTGGREAKFSGWEQDGRLRFHFPDGNYPEGVMRYLTMEEILEVYKAWEPGNDRKLIRQIGKICRYKDVRKSVLIQLINTYG